jgi:hypothetical protein|nr:MAG TPA: portal protein [Crassvirales sp.]
MAYSALGGFPPQQLSYNRKNKAWRKRCVDFGDDHSLLHHHLARKSVIDMRINYDLLNGKLHVEDLKLYLNPFNLDASFIPDSIQHYPIINSKLNVLLGEEMDRVFDYRVVVTNPNAVSEIEEEKNAEINQKLLQLVADDSKSNEEYRRASENLSDYFQYQWQDKREQRANMLLNHYVKELDVEQLLHKGFQDALTVGEEAYQVDIVGGEPVVWKINPMKMRIIKSSGSDKIEDADMIVLEDYWSPGKIIDVFYDQLSKDDVKALENPVDGDNLYTDSMDNLDPRYGFINAIDTDWKGGVFDVNSLFDDNDDDSLLPYDFNGNVRVLRVYWKSRRKIKKVKSYDPETGEETFNFYPENYVIDPDKGEEEQSFWVNEAWEGTKIGKDIYVNMRPRPVQYNRLSNPSRCHFGIIGSIYSNNGYSPFSLVDMVKPYTYMYDVYHDRLNKLIAKNKGKIIRMDFAKVPKGWDADKWLYYITVNGIAVENSFKEGTQGMATGKLAGAMNNASSGMIDASLGNDIQQYISLLTWLDQQIGKIMGISPQREGQISNRETVGGVERATLQSSHITQWLFNIHENVKKRLYECLMETAKICLRGRKKKFSYILPDGAEKMTEIDGDEFAENDYGLVVDNSNGVQELNQKLDMLAQAALQNQALNFSTIMKLYATSSLQEKQRMIETYEKRMQEMQQQQQQQQMQLQQQQMQLNAQAEQQKQQLEYQINRDNNETKLLVAQINSQAESQRYALMNQGTVADNDQKERKLNEQVRQFDERMKQQADKLSFDIKKHDDEVRLKERQLRQKSSK